jgi:EAL domain-containing protein (putative c-di-GMP-specific phosphodiesterase class I)
MKSSPIAVKKSRRSMVTPWWWLALAVLFVSFASLSYWYTKRSLIQEQEQLATALSQKLLAPMVLNDQNYAQHVLDFLKDQPGVVSASVVDANGGVVAVFDPMGESESFALAQLDDGRSRFERSELLVMSPVSVGNQVLGNVHMRVDTTPSFSGALSTTTIVFGLLAMGLFWMQSQGIKVRIAPKESQTSARTKLANTWSAPDQAVHAALEGAGIHLRYVPITHLANGSLHGVEAMVQWSRPDASPIHVSTAEFIGLAERNDLVLPFEEWVLKTAFSQVAHWHAIDGSLKLSFNISAAQFNNPAFPQRVHDLCAEYALPCHAVALEIHEGVLLHMSSDQLQNFESFERMGLPLTIDGFGSTAQSHHFLRRLPLAAVKFDKRLMAQSEQEQALSARLQALANLAATRQVPFSVEGLTSPSQKQTALGLGCQTGQGNGIHQSLASHTLDAIYMNNSEQRAEGAPWQSVPTSTGAVGI